MTGAMTGANSGAIRIVLADDHAVLRAGLRAYLEEQVEPRMQVVGEASSGEEAIELVQRVHPHLLLLDLAMPGLGGLGTAIELRRRGLPVRIIVVSQYGDPARVRRAFEARVNGYVLKSARGEELLAAIRAVYQGGTYIDPALAGSLVTSAVSPERSPASEEETYESLTPREREVLKLVAEGYSNAEIAAALDIAVKTAMAHRANLMEKLGIHNRSKLVQFAIRMGLVTVD